MPDSFDIFVLFWNWPNRMNAETWTTVERRSQYHSSSLMACFLALLLLLLFLQQYMNHSTHDCPLSVCIYSLAENHHPEKAAAFRLNDSVCVCASFVRKACECFSGTRTCGSGNMNPPVWMSWLQVRSSRASLPSHLSPVFSPIRLVLHLIPGCWF